MIELRNVTKYYAVQHGVRYILNDVSLTIPSRTNVAVIGSNGAGKSTLLRLIGGAEPANSGSIITDADVSWPLGLASGFQGTLTGRQNVVFVCNINGLNRKETRQVIRIVCEFAEIGEYFDMPVETYSSGMRARLGFGLSMAFRFDVYLIDELTSVGDANFKKKASKAFAEISNHASLIFVSHNLNTLRDTCQSALFLRDGHADFYPDLEDGIAVYSDYARANNHEVGKHGAMKGLNLKKKRNSEKKPKPEKKPASGTQPESDKKPESSDPGK